MHKLPLALDYSQLALKVSKPYGTLTEDSIAITVSKFQERLWHSDFFLPNLEQLSLLHLHLKNMNGNTLSVYEFDTLLD